MKKAARKLQLHRETLSHLLPAQVAGGATTKPFCAWASELYTACNCPPTWQPGCAPMA